MTIDCYITLGTERETVYSAEAAVRDMDTAGVDMAVAAPADREIAVLNQQGNDYILAETRKFPDRLLPACTVNPWYGNKTLDVLHRAVESGAKMLVLDPTVQGFLINDDLVDPVLEKVCEYRIPVYVHTGPHLYGAPWQLVECALRFPDINFIMGHAGSTDYWNDIPHAGSFAPNIYVEASFVRPFLFKSHLETISPEKGIMGSAAPRNNLIFEWKQFRSELNTDSYTCVFGENLAALLELEGPEE